MKMPRTSKPHNNNQARQVLNSTMNNLKPALLIALLLGIQSCGNQPSNDDGSNAYYDNLLGLCGSRYVGEMTFPLDGQDSFAGKTLVAHFKSCSQDQVLVPFSVGEDKSRTWVFTNSDDGLSLKHDHRHADGTPDEVTNYGGNAQASGSAFSQAFAADDYTKELIPEASSNVWTVTLSADKQQLTYHLERHQKPRFTAVLQRAN